MSSQNHNGRKILGYSDKLTARPGEVVRFFISSPDSALFHAQVVRLINGDTSSADPGFQELEVDASINGEYPGHFQPTYPGSYAIVDNFPRSYPGGLSAIVNFSATTPRRSRQHIVGQWDATQRIGWAIHLDALGNLCCSLSGGNSFCASYTLVVDVVRAQWYRTAIAIDLTARTLSYAVSSVSRGVTSDIHKGIHHLETKWFGPIADGISLPPLMIAAAYRGRTPRGAIIPAHCFNGRIEGPVIYGGPLALDALESSCHDERIAMPSPPVLGHWDFSCEIGTDIVVDRSGHLRHGRTINLPLRAVRGTRWTGTEYCWRHATSEYAAIHFHADDLVNCDWAPGIEFIIPDSLRSGIYALRLRTKACNASSVLDPYEDYIPFFVAAKKRQPTNRLALLVPTYTYLAYGNVRAWETEREVTGEEANSFYKRAWVGPGSREFSTALKGVRHIGASTYDLHEDGSPVHFSSWHRPLLNLRPKGVLWTFCADLLIADWLEHFSFPYDVITDDLLDLEGLDLLKDYSVVITGNHPEYQPTGNLRALRDYLNDGGRLLYMGGNGFYWRCATLPTMPGVLEVRRGRVGTSIWQSPIGEDYLSFTGERGGIWKELDDPPQRLVGVGFIAEGRDHSYFRLRPEAIRSAAQFILEGVHSDIVGDYGIFGGAVGQEIDASNPSLGTPPHAILIARSENHSPEMVFVVEEMNPVDPDLSHYKHKVSSDVIFFETLKGGAVFAAGSMAWCGSLRHQQFDNDIARISNNVLARFLDARGFD